MSQVNIALQQHGWQRPALMTAQSCAVSGTTDSWLRWITSGQAPGRSWMAPTQSRPRAASSSTSPWRLHGVAPTAANVLALAQQILEAVFDKFPPAGPRCPTERAGRAITVDPSVKPRALGVVNAVYGPMALITDRRSGPEKPRRWRRRSRLTRLTSFHSHWAPPNGCYKSNERRGSGNIAERAGRTYYDLCIRADSTAKLVAVYSRS